MFPERLKSLRTEKKHSQEYMGDLLGITRQAYAKYENNESEPDIATINKLSSFFSVTNDYLLGKTDKKDGLAEPKTDTTLDDPQLGLWFKEGKRSSAANRQKALDFLKYLEEQEKDRKPGDKQ
jgi:transcriptional regulator with XRE-family HTH domain